MKHLARTAALSTLLVVAVAGCGSDAPSGSPDSSTPSSEATSASTTATTATAATTPTPSVIPEACAILTASDVGTAFGTTATGEAGKANAGTQSTSCEYGSISGRLEVSGVAASLRITVDAVTKDTASFNAGYVGSTGFAESDKLAGVGVLAYAKLTPPDTSGIESATVDSVALLSNGLTVNVRLGVVNGKDQPKVATKANQDIVVALLKKAVAKAGA